MKKNTLSPLTDMSTLVAAHSSRAPLASKSNAGYLMGDIEDAYGDAEDAYGDVDTSPLDVYNTLIGEVDEELGAPARRKILGLGPKGQRIAAGAAGATALGFATSAVIKGIRRRKARRAIVARAERANAAANTIQNQVQARQLLGKIPRNAKFPFYQITGGTLNQFPLDPTAYFVANDLRVIMDLQSTQTPFESEIVPGTFAAGTFTMTANGVATNRIYACVLVTLGISTLTANPGTIFTVAGSFPLVNGGTLTVAANPWSFTFQSGWYAKLLIFPWQLITNKPYLAMGTYAVATPITVTVTGLPSNATTNMIVPGSAHPWTTGMRNAMI